MKVNSQVQYNNRIYTIVEINETDGSLNITQSGKDIINCKREEAQDLSASSVSLETDTSIAAETPSNLASDLESESSDSKASAKRKK